jgi:hypothetical protein
MIHFSRPIGVRGTRAGRDATPGDSDALRYDMNAVCRSQCPPALDDPEFSPGAGI